MATYDLLRDFASTDDGVISATPSWVIAVVEFAHAITFSRTKLAELKSEPGRDSNVSKEMDPGENARARRVMVVSSDCVQLIVQTTKSSHISSLSATLLRGETNYMSEIMPGDWVLAWMLNSQEDAVTLVKRIRNGEASNYFSSGLKFVGRVQSMRENTQIDRGSGLLRTRYYLQGVGFKELDTTVFFEPAFQRRFTDIGTFLGALGFAIGDFIVEGKGIDVNAAIPSLLKRLMGEGLPTSITNPSGDTAAKATTGLEAPYAYTLPMEVAALLGRHATTSNSSVAVYGDILELLTGLQHYTESGDNPADILIPDGVTIESTHRTTNRLLMGNFVPQSPQFINKTVWTILSQYLNPAINEMYTCLRATKYDDGFRIMPTIIVRQLPFSTPLFSKERTDVTPFHELPRWKADPKLVFSYDIGRSNAMRFNFIHVYGQAPMTLPGGLASAAAYVFAPPVRDTLDIQRNGLFGDFMDVPCDVRDMFTGPQKWMQIRGDWQLGMHLTMTGTVQMKGIQAPICEGDNFEFNGVVYHIESILHSCSLDDSGRRSFSTSVNLTHGIVADASKATTDTDIYATMFPHQGRELQPRITYEAQDNADIDKATGDLAPVDLDE